MSNGSKESLKQLQTSLKKRQRLEGDDFGHAVAKIAVSRICESSGLHGCQGSAIDALADVAVRYIRYLGKAAIFYANLAGRTSCNVFDVIQGLQELELGRGFAGASDVRRCLVSSGVVREISKFVSTGVDVPFGQPIPRFPVPRITKPTPSFAQFGEAPAGKHIPGWLPRFPDPHTYIHTPVADKRVTDAKADNLEQSRQWKKAERSLLSLRQRLACSGTTGYQLINDGAVGKGKQVIGNNPFLAQPFSYREKEVSEIAIPRESVDGKMLSELETFAAVLEASKSGSHDSDPNEKMILPSSRPTVHFKIRLAKKSTTKPFSPDVLDVKKNSWFLRDDEKDDKKGTEMILTEATDKQHDLALM